MLRALTQAVATPLGLLAMLVASLVAAVLLQLIKFPASWMFGAMLAAGVLHGAGLVEGPHPAAEDRKRDRCGGPVP